MANPFDDENGEFIVLVNDELQYSLWPAFREIPPGWKSVGPRGKRDECLEYIEKNWTDMRPKSLVEKMNQEAAVREQGSAVTSKPN
jgi:MbtH protein